MAAITRQDLVEWHGKYVHPNNIILGVVGDFDSAKMEARLREAFATWPKGPAASDPEIKPEPGKPGYYEVDKTDVNQSNIQMVALGITRKNPDYFATSVFNEAFRRRIFVAPVWRHSNHQGDLPTQWAAEWARDGTIRECCE